MPDTLLYTRDHHWVRPEGDLACVGLSDFAQRELGEVAYVQLPSPGRRVEAGEAIITIDSMKSTSDISSPLTGVVVQVNTLLGEAQTVGLVNSDPLGKGWLFVLRMDTPQQLRGMLSAEEYDRYVTGA
jgi:glycine cleavage system H protein